MKKTVLMIACALATSVAFAQDMNSKKGTPILPASGDWSIGIDASPFLNYAGNLMNDNADGNDLSFNWQNPLVLTGKMMKDDNTAYRAGLRLGFGSTSASLQDVNFGDDLTPFIVDSADVKTSGMNINLAAGLQMYRGQGRLKGFYGAEAGLGLSSGKVTWDGSENGETYSREVKAGSGFSFGVRGFIGVEYFFAPKMSISGEYGWGLGLNSIGEGEDTITFGGDSETTKTGKSSSFGVDTDNAGGAINLNFYF